MFDSSCSNTPSREPSCASARNSSRLTLGPRLPRVMARVTRRASATSGHISTIRTLQEYAVKLLRRFQWCAPRVFGMISEKIRIASVSAAEVSVTKVEPNTICAWAPTPAAPKVLAMVLRLRIAASGRLISRLSSWSTLPARTPRSFSTAIWAGVIDSSEASRIEHRKETQRASAR